MASPRRFPDFPRGIQAEAAAFKSFACAIRVTTQSPLFVQNSAVLASAANLVRDDSGRSRPYGRLVRAALSNCCRQSDGETGALVEFFYDVPGSQKLLHGADVLNIVRPATNSDRPHDVATNIRAMRVLRLADPPGWWARVLAFDALIGNGDRHAENWGSLATFKNGTLTCEHTPAYDHGSSLGYELAEKKLGTMHGPTLDAYIARGKHHCGYDAHCDGPCRTSDSANCS